MTLLITPNGFPLNCSKEVYEIAAREVELVLGKRHTAAEITFDVQLSVLTIFVKALRDVGGFFKPIVNEPRHLVNPTVVSFLTSMASDVSDLDKKVNYALSDKNIVLWSSLFSLAPVESDSVPPSKASVALLKDASLLEPHQFVTRLSRSRSISEIMDMMKIMFGDHTRT